MIYQHELYFKSKTSSNSINIKLAFFTNRQVYLKPPKDFAQEGKVWLLKKTVYGLTDMSESWYIGVKEELLKLNVKVSKYDPCVTYVSIQRNSTWTSCNTC